MSIITALLLLSECVLLRQMRGANNNSVACYLQDWHNIWFGGRRDWLLARRELYLRIWIGNLF